MPFELGKFSVRNSSFRRVLPDDGENRKFFFSESFLVLTLDQRHEFFGADLTLNGLGERDVLTKSTAVFGGGRDLFCRFYHELRNLLNSFYSCFPVHFRAEDNF